MASSPNLPQVEPQNVPDTLQTIVIDTLDTSDVVGRFSREVSEAGRLLAEGNWDIFWMTTYEGLAALLVAAIPRVASAIFVFVLFYIIYRTLASLLRKLLRRSRRVDPGLQNLLLKTFRVVAMLFIFVMVLAQFGFNVTALLAGVGIVGIAIGFAAQDTIQNFISGITILIDAPFRVGDNIDVDGVYGTVEDITLRSTRIRTLNNEIMVMPNIEMVNQKLVNHTMLGTIRVEVPFGIAYKESPQQARDVVLRLTEGDTRLHEDYQPKVVVTALNDSSVDMSLRIFLKNPKLEVPVRFEYLEKIREALREADIEIPYPHLQLFVDEAKALDGSFLMRPDFPPSSGERPQA